MSDVSSGENTWFRRIKPWQFSLRTLLVIMAIASAVCWYFLLPNLRDEKLANGYLILQRQYREKTINIPGRGPQEINDGYWRLKDLEGRLLVDGNYRQDKEHGWWTMYHPNGRRAAQGKMWKGNRDGVWKTWSEEGQLLSEVTYGVQQPLSDFSLVANSNQNVLQGSARFWHPNGKPSAAGKFASNERDGAWEEWDEQGVLIGAGEYRQGKKHGAWRELAAGEKRLAPQTYVHGLRQEQLTECLRKLALQLDQAELPHRITLLQVAAELGEPALPLLEKWAGSENPLVQLAAIQGIGRCGGKMEPWKDELQRIAASENHDLPRGARRELFRHFPDTRAEHFAALLDDAEQLSKVSPEDGLQQLREMFVADPPRRVEMLPAILKVVAGDSGSILPQTIDPAVPAALITAWHEAILPFVDSGLSDSDPKNRLAAVMLLRQMLVERNEFIDGGNNQGLPKWKVPPPLISLVERARRDDDVAVKAKAAHIDEPFVGFGSGGGGGMF